MKINNKKGFTAGLEIFLIVLVFVAIISSFLGFTSIAKKSNNEYFQDKTYKIYSIERDKKTTGDFVLGNGNINSKPVYYAYTDKDTKEGEKGYTLIEIPGDAIFLEIEKDSLITPHVEEKNYNCKDTSLLGKICDKEVKVFIPQHSIIKKFTPPTENSGNNKDVKVSGNK